MGTTLCPVTHTTGIVIARTQRLSELGTDAPEAPIAENECIGCAEAPPVMQFSPCCHVVFCEGCFVKWRQVC